MPTQNTYWEAPKPFPQWVQVDLGRTDASASYSSCLLHGERRNETLSVLGSTDNTTWTTVKASRATPFGLPAANTVTITFTATTQRYFR